MLSLDLKHESVEQGRRLKAARKLTLLSRRAFAIKYKFNTSSYQAWEDGKYKKGISLANAHKIIKSLAIENIDCNIEWLLNGNGEPAVRKHHAQLEMSLHTASEAILASASHNKKVKLLNNKMIEAIKRNNIIECKDLIKQGANFHLLKRSDLYLYSLKRFSALHFAAWYAGPLLIQIFIDLGIPPNIRGRDDDTPLHMAAYEGSHNSIKKLLDVGASIEATNKEGTTPLMWAALSGRPATIEYLVSLGALVNYTDFNGNSAVHWAAFHGHASAIVALYENGAYLDKKNYEDNTPLDLAIINGQIEAAKTILTIFNKV